jgi:hypothetical protein
MNGAGIVQSIYRLGYELDDRVEFDSRRGLGIFLFTTASRTSLGPTQPPIQSGPGIKPPGREADHSPLSSAEVGNMWNDTSTPPYVFMAWCLVKHRTTLSLRYLIGKLQTINLCLSSL